MCNKLAVAVFCLIATGPAIAKLSDKNARTIPSLMKCDALSSHAKKFGAFIAPLNLSFVQGTLAGERKPKFFSAKEMFRGKIDKTGNINLSGEYDDERSAWVYKFVGKLSDIEPTVIEGSLDVTHGKPIHRHCTLTLLPTPTELKDIVSAEPAGIVDSKPIKNKTGDSTK